MATVFTGIEIVKTNEGLFYGLIEDEKATNEYDTIDEVASAIDNYYYNMYCNCGYTTTYRVREKKVQPKKEGIVATMSVKLLEL